jgi:hypothetical protein
MKRYLGDIFERGRCIPVAVRAPAICGDFA